MGDILSIRGGLILIIIGITIILTLKNPKFGIMAFIFLSFSRDNFLFIYYPYLYTILRLPLLFTILAFVSWLIHIKEHKIELPIQLWLMLSFFIVICISRFLAGTGVFNHEVPNEFFKMCVLFFLIINTIHEEKDIKQIILVLLAVNLYTFLYHYYYYKIMPWNSVFFDPIWHFLNRNQLAAIFASLCPVAYFTALASEKKYEKVFLLFCIFCFIAGVILTKSRGGFLALAVALIMIIIFSKQRGKVIFVVLIFGLIMTSRISTDIFNRIGGIADYEQDASAMGRVATNYAALNMIKTHPLFGVGAGNFNAQFLDYTPANLLEYVAPGKSIHNIILQAGSETGIIGLCIFLSLVMKSFWDIIKIRRLYSKQPENLQSIYNMTISLGLAFFVYFFATQFGQGAYYSYIYIYLPLIVSVKQIYYSKFHEEIEDVKSENFIDNPIRTYQYEPRSGDIKI